MEQLQLRSAKEIEQRVSFFVHRRLWPTTSLVGQRKADYRSWPRAFIYTHCFVETSETLILLCQVTSSGYQLVKDSAFAYWDQSLSILILVVNTAELGNRLAEVWISYGSDVA